MAGSLMQRASAGLATERAMDLLDSTYNKLERVAVSADEWLTAALRRWDSWSTRFRLAALNERQLKEQLIWVISQKRDPAAATRLMEIAKSDPDSELRKKAIFWLGQTNDPRVKDFMLEIINAPR